MNKNQQTAVDYHKQGYNCAQAVLCTYCHHWGMDKETAYRIAEGYGGGMGQLGEVCGAISATFSAAGLKNSGGINEPGTTKKDTYSLVRKMSGDFKNAQGSILCRELLKDKSRPKQEICEGCIATACEILEKYLLDKE